MLVKLKAENAKRRLGFTFTAQEVEHMRHALARYVETLTHADRAAPHGCAAATLSVKLLKRLARRGLRGEVTP